MVRQWVVNSYCTGKWLGLSARMSGVVNLMYNNNNNNNSSSSNNNNNNNSNNNARCSCRFLCIEI